MLKVTLVVFKYMLYFFSALSEAMASESRQRFSRGRRQMRNITIETYTNDLGEARPRGLIPGSESRESTPRCPTDGKVCNERFYTCFSSYFLLTFCKT